jgi:hypothetical protein
MEAALEVWCVLSHYVFPHKFLNLVLTAAVHSPSTATLGYNVGRQFDCWSCSCWSRFTWVLLSGNIRGFLHRRIGLFYYRKQQEKSLQLFHNLLHVCLSDSDVCPDWSRCIFSKWRFLASPGPRLLETPPPKFLQSFEKFSDLRYHDVTPWRRVIAGP